MKPFVNFFQIAVSLILILAILLQAKGVGLSSVFGGGGGFYRSKRGLEKILFLFTVLISILFILVSILSLIA